MASLITNVWFSQAYYDYENPQVIYVTWDLDKSVEGRELYMQVSKSTDGVTWSEWHWDPRFTGDWMTYNSLQNRRIVFVQYPGAETNYIKCRLSTNREDWAESNNCVRSMVRTKVSEWEPDKITADAGDTVTVSITQTYQASYVTPGIGYTHKVHATFGEQAVSAELAEYETEATLTLPKALLREMPEDTSMVGLITVETYREGTFVGSTSKEFTLTCPQDVLPFITCNVSRLLTVGGVTYPDVTGGYVQNKSAVLAEITSAEGIYGSYIVSYRINVAGRYSAGYNSDTKSLSSALLVDSGVVQITFEATDSRGRTTGDVKFIVVEPYSPPQASFRAWRVNESGEPDVRGRFGKYEYDYTFTDLGGRNTCTTSLTVAGRTATNVPESGELLPNERLELSDTTTYSVVLTLTDAYGSELFASVLSGQSSTTVVIRPAKHREKRRMIFGEYDTALDGLWTLTGWTLPEPEYQRNFVEIPGRHGLLDLSTVLTDGEPIYGNRTLTATFESSEGTRMERNERISDMVNTLDGRRMHIVLPDDQTRYLDGRVRVQTAYSDPAHASVSVTAECEPWRYNVTETHRAFALAEDEQRAMLVNDGRRIAVPTVTVLGDWAKLRCNGYSWQLYDGVYTLPDLTLPRGKTLLTYSGRGTLIISYREAVL